MFGDDFVEDASLVADNFSSQAYIKIFERDGEQVRAVEGTKKINAGMIFTTTTSAGSQGRLAMNAL